MYPNLGSGSTQPSAPPPPSSTLGNSGAPKPVGFSSLMSQPTNQSTPYPPTGGQSLQTPYPSGPSSQTPYPPSGQPSQTPYPPGGQSAQTPYPPGGQSAQAPYPPGGQSAQAPYPPGGQPAQTPYNNPYASNNQPPNNSNYSPYALPGQQPQRPPAQGGSGYPPNPYQQQQGNPYQSSNPSAGYPGQQPPPPTGYQNPSVSANPYQSQQAAQNPYAPQQGAGGYQNPYQQQQQPPYNPQQPPYNPQQQQQHQPYQNPYGSNPQQPPAAGGYNANSYGSQPVNDRIRAIAGRYEISDALAQRLNILQQFELVILCDDSGSMNTPVDGTNGTRWDELRSIVQIIMEIGTVFDSNGVDVHFLNRPSMPNVTDSRQVVESFSQRPSGLTPLTASLRRIFQTAAAKPGSDKRLLVFVATDGAPTDANGTVDIQGLEQLLRNERNPNTTYITFLACTDDESSVAYLSQWDRTMMNVDVVDDYKTEREEVRRNKGYNFPFSFGDYVVKALLGAIDPTMDSLDESGNNNNNYNNNNNFRRF